MGRRKAGKKHRGKNQHAAAAGARERGIGAHAWSFDSIARELICVLSLVS